MYLGLWTERKKVRGLHQVRCISPSCSCSSGGLMRKLATIQGPFTVQAYGHSSTLALFVLQLGKLAAVLWAFAWLVFLGACIAVGVIILTSERAP